MKLLKAQKGQVFIPVLVLLLVGSLLIAASLQTVAMGFKISQNSWNRTDSLYAADSGTKNAIWQINAHTASVPIVLNGSWNYNLPTQINSNTVNVTILCYALTPVKTYKITSVASANGKSTHIDSFVTMIAGTPGIFDRAIVGLNGNVDIHGNSVVGSASQDVSVYANGNVIVSSNQGYLYGDAVATGTVTDKAMITGQELESQPPIVFPVINPTQAPTNYRANAQAGGTYNGNYPTITGTRTLGPIYIDGTLSISSTAQVTLTGDVYVTGNIAISGFITGAFHLVGEKTITFSGSGATLGTGAVPYTTVISTRTGTAISLNSTGVLYGLFYAPNGTIQDNSGSTLYGSLYGKDVVVANHSTVIFQTGQSYPPGSGGEVLGQQTWQITLS